MPEKLSCSFKEKRLKDMTEEEAEYWDEYYTNNTIIPNMNKPGFFTCKYGMTVKLDPEVTRFLIDRAEAMNKTPNEVINELLHEKISAFV